MKFFENEFPFATNQPRNVVTPMLIDNKDGAWSEDEGDDECVVCIEGGLEAVSTLERGMVLRCSPCNNLHIRMCVMRGWRI